jgi:tetrapyrrole methylase family protein/MazG family protein
MRADKVLGRADKLDLENREVNSANGTNNLYTELECEVAELKGLKEGENEAKMDKIGKILLLIANISRKNEINPEFALTNALETYINKLE